jgi:hypothetical protein
MFAVSVEQPQAAAILAALRPATYRFWQTDYRGPLLIHAARRKAGPASPEWVEGLAYNAILGVVELADCLRDDHPGADPDEASYHWVLTDPRAFASPLPYIGRQGLFQIADAAVAGALALAVRPGRGAPQLGE